MAEREPQMRRVIGGAALFAAAICMVWLPLGLMDVIPFVFEIPGESRLRMHAAAAVLSLLVAAWGFWEHEF